jgi:hypothetical protein
VYQLQWNPLVGYFYTPYPSVANAPKTPLHVWTPEAIQALLTVEGVKNVWQVIRHPYDSVTGAINERLTKIEEDFFGKKNE